MPGTTGEAAMYLNNLMMVATHGSTPWGSDGIHILSSQSVVDK